MVKMKNIFRVTVLLLLSVWIIGCSDDADDVKPSVIKSDVNFTAEGGKGTIEVSAQNNITASSDNDWCVVNVTGAIVEVTVTANENPLGRTALVTLQAGSETLSVPVTQAGMLLLLDTDELSVFFAGGEGEVTVTKNLLPFHVAVADDWVTYSVDGNKIIFTVEPSVIPRVTYASVTSDILTRYVEIYQGPSYSDLLGNWVMTYTVGGSNYNIPVKLLQKTAGTTYTLSGIPINSQYTANLQVTFNPLSGNLAIAAGQYIGNLGSEYYTFCLFSSQGNLSWDTTAQYEAMIDLSQPVFRYRFADNGTWPDNTVMGFSPETFYTEKPSMLSHWGAYYQYINVVLTKL